MIRVKLLRDARIRHKAGEIVTVSPAECRFFESLGIAKKEPVKKAEPKPKKEPEKAKEVKKTK